MTQRSMNSLWLIAKQPTIQEVLQSLCPWNP
jgi:hypothetical protein